MPSTLEIRLDIDRYALVCDGEAELAAAAGRVERNDLILYVSPGARRRKRLGSDSPSTRTSSPRVDGPEAVASGERSPRASYREDDARAPRSVVGHRRMQMEPRQVTPHDDQVHPPLMELLEGRERSLVGSNDREGELRLLAGRDDRRVPIDPETTVGDRETEWLRAPRTRVAFLANGRVGPMLLMCPLTARIRYDSFLEETSRAGSPPWPSVYETSIVPTIPPG